MLPAFNQRIHSVVRPFDREATHVVEIVLDVINVIIIAPLRTDDPSARAVLTEAIEKRGAARAIAGVVGVLGERARRRSRARMRGADESGRE